MALDAIFLKGLVGELSAKLTGGKIERINEPARGTVVLTVKAGSRVELFIGGSSGSPRIHLTEANFERPQEPPMFCMLLRKHLTGARIISVTQPALDRVVSLRLTAPGMFGEGEERYLHVELFGRAVNMILTDGEGIITDCLYRTGSAQSERAVLPGLKYRLPPMQDKADLLSLTRDEIGGVLKSANKNASDERTLDRAVLGSFLGISPLIARELAYLAYGDTGIRVAGAREIDGLEAIIDKLCKLAELVHEGRFAPTLIRDREGEPFDFSYMPVSQYGVDYVNETAGNFSKLLDGFYTRRDSEERRRQRARELTRTVRSARDRVARRLAAQRQELGETERREWFRECGDLITANIYAMRKGAAVLEAEDFYSETGGVRSIPLDPRKTPQQNAAKYYKDYNRLKSAKVHLTRLIAQGEEELEYLESVLDELARAEDPRDLAEIRAELRDGGYIRATSRDKRERRAASAPMRFRSTAGFDIRVGRNNAQNDALTKSAGRGDIWLHTQKIHGSHVIISAAGAEVDGQTLAEAASLAAFYSQGRDSGKVAVDITLAKHVKKPAGARPGMVIYTDYKTVAAVPDGELAEKLRVK